MSTSQHALYTMSTLQHTPDTMSTLQHTLYTICSTYTLPVIHLAGCSPRGSKGRVGIGGSIAPPALGICIRCLVGHGDHRHSQLS